MLRCAGKANGDLFAMPPAHRRSASRTAAPTAAASRVRHRMSARLDSEAAAASSSDTAACSSTSAPVRASIASISPLKATPIPNGRPTTTTTRSVEDSSSEGAYSIEELIDPKCGDLAEDGVALPVGMSPAEAQVLAGLDGRQPPTPDDADIITDVTANGVSDASSHGGSPAGQASLEAAPGAVSDALPNGVAPHPESAPAASAAPHPEPASAAETTSGGACSSSDGASSSAPVPAPAAAALPLQSALAPPQPSESLSASGAGGPAAAGSSAYNPWERVEEALALVIGWLHSLTPAIFQGRPHEPPGKLRQYMSVQRVANLLTGVAQPPLLDAKGYLRPRSRVWVFDARTGDEATSVLPAGACPKMLKPSMP